MSSNTPSQVAVEAKPTSPPWVPFDIPGQGWAACWQGPKDFGGLGPNGDLYPICHMRWTDGMRPNIELRLEAEVKLICEAVNNHASLQAEVAQLREAAKFARSVLLSLGLDGKANADRRMAIEKLDEALWEGSHP